MTRVAVRGALTLASLLMVLCLHATVASAFCRATTCEDDSNDPKRDCHLGSDGCPVNGAPLFWASGCVSYAVHEAGSPSQGLSYEVVQNLADRAFASWLNADCGSGPPALSVVDLSPAVCDKAEYNLRHGNANVIVFRSDEWPYSSEGVAVAVTVTTFNTETGELYDADIEINAIDVDISVGGGRDSFDLGSILTHEAGHFLGLAHAVNVNAVMYNYGLAGTTSMRQLTSDDTAGICTIYPARGNVDDSQCAPRRGFSEVCAPNESSGCGCRLPGNTTAVWPIYLAVSLLLGAWCRRWRRLK